MNKFFADYLDGDKHIRVTNGEGLFLGSVVVFFLMHSPAGFRHRNDVPLTSMRSYYVASTSIRHRFDVMC